MTESNSSILEQNPETSVVNGGGEMGSLVAATTTSLGGGNNIMLQTVVPKNNDTEEQQTLVTTPMGITDSDNDDIKQSTSDEETLTLPESTHSFLFTEPINSIPFYFSVGIAAMSYACLILALINNLQNGEVPANVSKAVRIAQYLSILIALLMEEEIPTGLYLLRRISQPYLHSKFPMISYSRFVWSNILRISMGYLFLVNVLVILVMAEDVLEIFYDVLALQFIQQLDDIAFGVSKLDVLGKRLQRATFTPYFRVEFQKQKNERVGIRWKMKIFLKGVYFINLVVFFGILIRVSVRQNTGYYQCESITVRYNDEVYEEAVVRWPMNSNLYQPGSTEEMILIYSYFNGVYKKDDSRSSEGRPIYVEQTKSDLTPFDSEAPLHPIYNVTMDPVVPAEIKYCDGHWIFTHENIRKSIGAFEEDYESDCPWLLRSPETDVFDVLEVEGKWQVWVGEIKDTEVSIVCNKCEDDADCNLNGECLPDGTCDCYADDKVTHVGTHCEVKVKEECRTILSESLNDRWSIDATNAFANPGVDGLVESYSRPVYTYVGGLPEDIKPKENDELALVYSGSRWFMINLEAARLDNAYDYWTWQTRNYHAFWARAYSSEFTPLVSDPTTSDTPVGVDFFWVGEQGNQYGPFGVLYPAQNETGRGVYRCEGYDKDICSFCPNGLYVESDFVIPGSRGATCGSISPAYVSSLKNGTAECDGVQLAQQFCCPEEDSASDTVVTSGNAGGPCPFCLNKTINEDIALPEYATTCGEVSEYAMTLEVNSESCQEIQPAEEICCFP